MQDIAISEQQELVGGDFSFGSFIRGVGCGGALAIGAFGGPIGIMAGVTACMVLTYDDAS